MYIETRLSCVCRGGEIDKIQWNGDDETFRPPFFAEETHIAGAQTGQSSAPAMTVVA